MVLYNVVIEASTDIETGFMEWFKKKHIPLIISTGYFVGFTLSKQIAPKFDRKFTAVCRFFCHNREDYDSYLNEFSNVMRGDFPTQFIDKCNIIRTVEEI